MKPVLSSKVEMLYGAIDKLVRSDADLNSITVSEITEIAGIGKGTVYDYFKNKEELIASALIYQTSVLCGQIKEEIERRETFREKIYYILNYMEERSGDQACILKGLHIMTGISAISTEIANIIKETQTKINLPKHIILSLVESAKKEGIYSKEFPMDYLILNMTSKLLVYGIFILKEPEKRECDLSVMKELIYAEFGNKNDL